VYHRNSIRYWVSFILVRGSLRAGLLRESPAELANRWSDGAIARHYTRESFGASLAPLFDTTQIRVAGGIDEAVPLPDGLRNYVERCIPLSLRRAIVRRWGWLLIASARRRSADTTT
jgi:hypothetical protein